MLGLELSLCGVLVAGLVLGGRAAVLSRAGVDRGPWTRVLVVGVVLLVGAGTLLAAWHRAEMLVPLGLAAVALLAILLQEEPEPGRE